MKLEIDAFYRWKHQTDILVYLGKIYDRPGCRGWHQFAKQQEPEVVWCEVRDEELHLLEPIEGEIAASELELRELLYIADKYAARKLESDNSTQMTDPGIWSERPANRGSTQTAEGYAKQLAKRRAKEKARRKAQQKARRK